MNAHGADTIAAIATARGKGAIGILRISGPEAKSLLSRVFLPHSAKVTNFSPWKLHHGAALDASGEPLDDVLAVYMPGPNSFTGEDVCEIHCHGNPVILDAALDHLLSLGARCARPGEFTRRAFLNGRIDLAQAEAVAELVAAPTRKGLRIGIDRLEGRLSQKIASGIEEIEKARTLAAAWLDFSEEETGEQDTKLMALHVKTALQGLESLLRHARAASLHSHGARIVLTGPVNAGKSTLLNCLSGKNRALVDAEPGTTRDFLEVGLELGGMAATLVDTAGLRENPGPVEAQGVARTWEQMGEADLLALVLDSQRPGLEEPWLDRAMAGEQPRVIIWNKTDLAPPPAAPPCFAGLPSIAISCATGENLDKLPEFIASSLLGEGNSPLEDGQAAPNRRQAGKIAAAARELEAMLAGIDNGVPLDCLASHLDMAVADLGEVLGLRTDEEVLNGIFSTFCIGK